MRLFNFGRKPRRRRSRTPKTPQQIYNECLIKELKHNPDKLQEFTIKMAEKKYGIDLRSHYSRKSQKLAIEQTKTDVGKEIS